MREKLRGQRPSPALVLSITALVFAVAGTGVASVATLSALSKKEKKQTRNIAKDEIAKAAPGLSVARANSAGSAGSAQNADQLDGLDSSAFASASAVRSVGPIGMDDPPDPGGTEVALFTLGAFTLTRSCIDTGSVRSAAVHLTASQAGGELALEGFNAVNDTPFGTDLAVGTIGTYSTVATGDLSTPGLSQTTVTLMPPGGEVRTAIFYAGANILGTDCVFGYTLFSP